MRSRPTRSLPARPRPGWVFIDIIMGLILIGLIGIMLAAGANWHRRALTHLADSRAASRLAESALISLQAGQPLASSTVHYRELSPPPDLAGMTWIELTATINGRSATLIGLVPKATAPTPQSPSAVSPRPEGERFAQGGS